MQQANSSQAVQVRSEWREDWPVVLSSALGIGLAQTLMSEIVATLSPAVGAAMDRFGARPLVLWGAFRLAVSPATLALTGGWLGAFYALWILRVVATTATSPIIWLKAVVDRFERNRGLASSIALLGSNIAGGITPLIAAWLIMSHGWQAAYLGLALYMIITAVPLELLFFHYRQSLNARSQKRQSGPAAAVLAADIPGLTLQDARKTREFWVLLASFFFAGAGITGYLVHAVSIFTSRGVSTMMAASAVSIFSIAAILNRLGAGWLMDRIFAPRLAAIALAISVGGMALLLGVPSYPLALLASAMVGLATGAEYNMISFLTLRYFGFRRYGTIAAWMNATFTLGCTGGPLLAVWLVSQFGKCDPAIIMFGAAFGLAAIIVLLCRRYEVTMPAASA